MVLASVAWSLVIPVSVPSGPTADAHREGTRAAAGASATRSTSTSACSDGAYVLYSPKWTSEYRFYIKSSTTPSGVNADSAASAIRAGVVNVVRGDNDCSIASNVGATASYQGSTSSPANITSSGGCGTRDSRNVVDFGTLPSGYLALTCWWSSGSTIVEADVRFNKSNYGWVTSTSGCSNKFMIEAAATHEFGHAFGMNHVSESSHGKLSLSPTIMACQNSESSLGLGDVRGLEAKY
jgi:hypothetical protein